MQTIPFSKLGSYSDMYYSQTNEPLIMQTQEEFEKIFMKLKFDAKPYTIDWSKYSVILIHRSKSSISDIYDVDHIKKIANDILFVSLTYYLPVGSYLTMGSAWFLLSIEEKSIFSKICCEVEKKIEPPVNLPSINYKLSENDQSLCLKLRGYFYNCFLEDFDDQSTLAKFWDDPKTNEIFKKVENNEAVKKTLEAAFQNSIADKKYKDELANIKKSYPPIIPRAMP